MIDEDNVILTLGWPPTINSYYGHARRGKKLVKFVTSHGQKYRDGVIESVHYQLPGLTIDYRMYVEVTLYPPDNRTRDLDNYMKSMLDALTHAKLWTDDSLIDQLFIRRGETVSNGGAVLIEICEAAPILRLPEWM